MEPAKIYTRQLCKDSGFRLEYLIGAIAYRDGWLDRLKRIRAITMTW